MIRLEKDQKPAILVENEDCWNADFVAYKTKGEGSAECEKRHRHKQIKEAVIKESYGKCIYCEEKILSSQFGDVEHICPKDVYPHLYAAWENLALSCTRCNNAKRTLDGLINPFVEEPTAYLNFAGPMVAFDPLNAKAKLTVRGVKLNRPELLRRRADAILRLMDKIDLMINSDEPMKSVLKEEILHLLESENEFAGTLRSIFESRYKALMV